MKELIIVDEHNEIIGYKKKSEVMQEDIFRVSACIIKNSTGKYLLAQRSIQKENKPGLWAYAAEGTLSKDESYESNILAKLESEVGVRGVILKKLYQKRRYGVHTFFHEIYLLESDMELWDLFLDTQEVEQVRWFSVEEIQEKEFEWDLISKKLQRDILFLEEGIESDY